MKNNSIRLTQHFLINASVPSLVEIGEYIEASGNIILEEDNRTIKFLGEHAEQELIIFRLKFNI